MENRPHSSGGFGMPGVDRYLADRLLLVEVAVALDIPLETLRMRDMAS
jgi:hypothetical protein